MKKINYIICLLFFTSTMSWAQLAIRPQVGINFPSLTEDISEGRWKGNVGYQFGADLQVGEVIYLQPGLNFESTRLTVEDVGELAVNRINLPILLGIRIGDTDLTAIALRIFGGANFAINTTETLDNVFMALNEENIRGSLVSGMVGAGVDLGILFVDAAYKAGFTDFFEDINNDSKKNIFIVNAGLRLGF